MSTKKWICLTYLTLILIYAFVPQSYAESAEEVFFSVQPSVEKTTKKLPKLQKKVIKSKRLRQNLANTTEGLIANYPLSQDANDSTDITGSMLLKNAQFKNNSLYLNGLYDTNESSGYSVSTPLLNIDYSELTFSLKFLPIQFGKNNSTYLHYRNNIITGGDSYRWLAIKKDYQDNRLIVSFNNNNESYTFENASLTENQWHTISFSLSLTKKKFLVVLDGKLLGEKILPANFNLEVIGSNAEASDKKLLFTNYSSGDVFYGNIKDLILFNRSFDVTELLSLNTSTTTNTPPTNTGYTDYFHLKLSQPLTVNASVYYKTRDGSAIAGVDYIAKEGTAIIPAGQTSVDIGIDILIADTNKTFSL